MEIFSNLLWLALSSLIISFWLRRWNRWADDSLRRSLVVQMIALALLIVVLLPVVSLTDDLQASAIPAESEHLARRTDFQASADFSAHTVAFLISELISFQEAPQLHTLAWLDLPSEKETPSSGYLRILGTRPPPAV